MIKCRNKSCDNEFVQYSTLQKLCIPCSIEKGRKIERKVERKAHKEAKERIKSRGDWLREAQAAFNRYIRARDYDKGCICCNNRKYDGQYHAGHWLSVGSHPELRFNEDNCHKQKSSCNSYKSGNQVQYRKYLIQKIGLERVEWLEGPHEPKKYTIEEIKAIKAKYSKKARELEAIIKAYYRL